MADFHSIGGNEVVAHKAGGALAAEIAGKADSESYAPSLYAGTADALTGATDTGTWAQRVVTSTDGVARVESVKGNTVVWNQLNNNSASTNTSGLTRTFNSDGSVTIDGTASGGDIYLVANFGPTIGHKYLIKGCPDGGSSDTYYLRAAGYGHEIGSGEIINVSTVANTRFLFHASDGDTFSNVKMWPQLFDLTQMFGAGNEPTSVAEFEALYPLPYYPYDSGTLKPVSMTGIETVGFNQWDEVWELGGIGQSTGDNSTSNTTIRSKNYIQVMPSATYYFNSPVNLSYRYYDSDKNYIGYKDANGTADGRNATRVMPSNACYLRFVVYDTYGTTYKHDICVNVSDPSLNGTYRPYMSDSRTFDAVTLRKAGSVADMLYSDRKDTYVGVVDLGTMNWTSTTQAAGTAYRALLSGRANGASNLKCAQHEVGTSSDNLTDGQIIGGMNSTYVYIRMDSCADEQALIAAVSGQTLFYELATPTTTPIDPPLALTYRVAQGGTESIVAPTGELTALPTLAVTYPIDADGIADLSLANVAPVENGVAAHNYSVGAYLIHGGTLYKVTSAIAVGESITPGTNCTATTVMAELAAINA